MPFKDPETSSSTMAKFVITWRIPNFSQDHSRQTICSHVCQHKSGIAVQLVASAVEGTYYSVYLVCSNAEQFAADEFADIKWNIVLGNSKASYSKAGSMKFTQKSDNCFRQPGCFDFIELSKFESDMHSLVESDGTLIIKAELSIITNFDPSGEADTTKTVFQKDEFVAICAPDDGFWIAQLAEPVNVTTARDVQVVWLDEQPQNSGRYTKTRFADKVSAASIHPVAVEMAPVSPSASSRTFTVRKTRAFEQFIKRLKET
eukprot:m.251356 g.251356  ORF g.251356 m.251356 type:complete len:260 (+) comp15449_c1_seq4:825-1604(+)